jgi:hypothetical protein
MKLPMSLEIIQGGYGRHCDACKRVTDTVLVKVIYRGEVFRQSTLCSNCIESGVEVDLNLELNTDPNKRVAAQKRVKQSRMLEQTVADDLGGRAQPGSGGTKLAGYKGDVRKIGHWRVEHKYTDSLQQYTIKLRDFAKIIGEALSGNENPAMIIDFRKARQALAVLPYTLFLELADAATKYRGPQARRRKGRAKGSG